MSLQDPEIFDHLIDTAILAHGFMPYSRDYYFHLETLWAEPDAGQHLLVFKHCYELNYMVQTSADTLLQSWSDDFLDMEAYRNAGEPVGYVWGTNFRKAYPGFSPVQPSVRAAAWTKSLGKSMYEVEIRAEILRINLVYHDFELKKLNSTTSTIAQVLFPINR